MIENLTLIADNEAANADSINSRFEKINSNFASTYTKPEIDTKLADFTAYTEATYTELKTLKDNNQLKTGQKYLLTDYVTKYQQPQSNKMKVGKYDLETATPENIQEETEPLLLTAISENEFAIECYSPMFPDDIVYYDFDDDTCEDGTTPRNGFILRRYFVKNEINVPNDWRKIKWARYEEDFGVAGTLLTYSGAGDNIYKGEYYTFDFNGVEGSSVCWNIAVLGGMRTKEIHLFNTVWSFDNETGRPFDITFGSGCYQNTFGDNCYRNTFGSTCFGNNFSSACHGNTFGSNCNGNTFGSNCNGNTLSSGCYKNTFGSNCNGNTLDSLCYLNTFDTSCSNNTLGSGCYNNAFAEKCSTNTLSAGCFNNILGSNCRGNTFGSYCNGNSFGDNCLGNNFSSYFVDNILGTNCSRNTFGSDCSNNTFGTYCTSNTFGSYCLRNTLNSNTSALFVKRLAYKDLSNISGLINANYTITIERMNDSSYCYWYKTGTNPTDVVTVQIP